MGVFLNPGNEAFRESVNSAIYVDMSGMIACTNAAFGTKQKNICVSRPRRFGKSMAAEMLSAYYDRSCDSRELFQGLRIAEEATFDRYRNSCDVIFLNMQKFLSRADAPERMTDYLQRAVLKDMRETYAPFVEESGTLSEVLERIGSATKTPFVFIIDEWDCIFREYRSNVAAQTRYLDFLRDLLKDAGYAKLVYMTGILPIKKYGTHSALNMFDEYTMTDPGMFAEYAGFGEADVMELCGRFRMDFDEMRLWYDGYRVWGAGHIYNPKSVVDAMRRGRLSNYWTRTETYEALKIYIEMNFQGLKDDIVTMLGGGRCRINPQTFQNDMTTFRSKDDVLTLLVHLGYLAYDEERREVMIPNREVEEEFAVAIESAGWDSVINAISASEELLNATLRMDEEAVAAQLDAVHMDAASILNYNSENALSCAVSLAYYSARNYYTVIRELPTGKGFADLVFLPRKKYTDKPALIVELKWDRTAEGAISQIKEKKYVRALDEYAGNLLLAGISYDKKTRVHTCRIEPYVL